MASLKELSTYETHTLPNGATMLVRKEPAAPYAYFAVRIGYGACHDTPEAEGAVHLLEHMFFSTNVCYEHNDIVTGINKLTGDAENASVNADQIQMAYCVPSENVVPLAHIIASMFNERKTNVAEFDAEKRTILHENGTPSKRTLFSRCVNSKLYPNHPYSRLYGDNNETTAHITLDQIEDIRQRYIGGPNLTLVLAGDISDKDVDSISQMFGNGTYEKSPKLPPVDPVAKNERLVGRFDTTKQPYVKVLHTVDVNPGKIGVVSGILRNYLGLGTSSMLNRTLREQQGLCYYVTCSIDNTRMLKSDFDITADGIAEQDIDRICALIETEIEKVKQRDIDRDHLELVKHSYVLTYPRCIETIPSRANWMLGHHTRGWIYDHQGRIDVVRSITP